MSEFQTWDFESKKDLLINIVGFDFGKDPEKNKEDLLYIREDYANEILRTAQLCGLKEHPVSLEIGSGFGYIARYIAHFVKKLYCCDISKSYLEVARKECEDLKNVEFHHIIKTGEFYFLKDTKVDLIYGAAVFIHLNLYDIYWYFHEFNRVLSDDGIIIFDIKCADYLNLDKDHYFHEHAAFYKNDTSCFSTLMNYNSYPAIMEIARYFGFQVFTFIVGRVLAFKRSKEIEEHHIKDNSYKKYDNKKQNITKNDFVLIENFEKSIKLSKSFSINLNYQVTEDRDILVDLHDNKWLWYGRGTGTVKKGKGKIMIDIKIEKEISWGYGYFYMIRIVPEGRTWEECIYELKTEYFEIKSN